MELAPFYSTVEEKIIDGDFLKIPKWCKNHYKDKCRRFYQSIINDNGFFVCPYGFTTYVKKIGTTKVIYTCLRVAGRYDRKKIIPKIKNDINNFEMNEQTFYDFIEKSISYNNKHYDMNSKIRELTVSIQKVREEKELLIDITNNTLHEIRSLNKTLKSQAEDIIATSAKYIIKDDNDYFGFRIKNINATSNLISTRLSSYDLINNNCSFFNKSLNKIICVHNKFYKTKQLLSTYFYSKKVKIIFNGESYSEIIASDTFEILPFIIYENYIKYSLDETQVLTEFKEDDKNIEISIRGIGPQLSQEENRNIFRKGFRGTNAEKLGVSGSGIGLYVAKIICDIFNIKIQIISEEKIEKKINKVPYSYFKVNMSLPIYNKQSKLTSDR